MNRPSVERFEGVSIVVSNIDATLHFWLDFVGGELVGTGTDDGRLPWRIAIGGAVVEVYQATVGQQPSPGSGNQHFCWDIEPVDVDPCRTFWVDFLGAEEYSFSKRLVQYLIGGILVDCFPPADQSKVEELPQPGSEAQCFRFSIRAASVDEWIDRAKEWNVAMR